LRKEMGRGERYRKGGKEEREAREGRMGELAAVTQERIDAFG